MPMVRPSHSITGIMLIINSYSLAADRETAKEEEVAGMFQLLHEIADDTSRIKLGGEDKIRVASLAVEHVSRFLNFVSGL
jgi:hypothetical protein